MERIGKKLKEGLDSLRNTLKQWRGIEGDSEQEPLSLLRRLKIYIEKLNHISWKSPRVIYSGAAVFALLVVGTVYLLTTTPAVRVVVNGQPLGYVATAEELEKILEKALNTQGEKENIFFKDAQTDDTVVYKKLRIGKKTFSKNQVAFNDLAQVITPYINGCRLHIGEDLDIKLVSRDEANRVLASFIEHYAAASDQNTVTSVEFDQDVVLVDEKVHPLDLKTEEEALAVLLAGKSQAKEYVVQPDDSLWLIARKNGILIQDILDANKGLTENSILHQGDVLKLAKMEPYINIVVKGQRTQTEKVSFQTITERDNSLANNKTVVKQEGQAGEKQVTVAYVEKNGVSVERTVLKEEVTKKPVNKVVVQGPVVVASASTGGISRGSGVVNGIQWPLSGPINSSYGYRGREFHTGIDIGAKTGTPYYAAASGKVVSAGWNGGYGYMVLIDHGNGVATRYAHSTRLAVSAGATVTQGQCIGYVGATGRASGPHLHFEIIINGSTVNPANYR